MSTFLQVHTPPLSYSSIASSSTASSQSSASSSSPSSGNVVSPSTMADRKIPPCITNWKNPPGHTVPLDKRLQTGTRGIRTRGEMLTDGERDGEIEIAKERKRERAQ